MAPNAAPQEDFSFASSDSASHKLDSSPSPSMEKNSDPLRKQFLPDSTTYKSALVYRPNDYYNASHKSKYYDDDAYDLEAEDKKAILPDPTSDRTRRRRRTRALCYCTSCYISFILLLVATILVVKLIPKDPDVSLVDLKVQEFVYNKSSNGAQQIRASLSFGLNLRNRNFHADAIYKEISVSLFFQNESLGSFRVSAELPFEQKKKMTTNVTADLPSTTTTIENSANAATLTTEMARSNVQVDLTGSIRGTLKVLGMKVKKFEADIMCKINVSPGDGESRAAGKPTLSCYG